MLKADGWKPHFGVVDHSLDSEKTHDARVAEKKSVAATNACSWLLNCLAGGAEPFLSTRPQSFFELLMKNPRKARSILSAKECSRLLKADNPEESALQDAMEARRVKRARRCGIAAVAEEVEAENGGDGWPRREEMRDEVKEGRYCLIEHNTCGI